MPRPSTGEYPPNWPEISAQVKADADHKCIRCHHIHEIETGYMLTVHHLDLNKSNCEWWNLAALCQRCHLQIQHKVVIERLYMFEHSEWFKPYAAGYYAAQNNLPTDKEFVLTHLDQLLDFGRPYPMFASLPMDETEYRKRFAARLISHGWPEGLAKEAADGEEFDPSDPEPEDHADDCHSYAMEDSR